MDVVKRTLLVVEDDKMLNLMLTMSCREVLQQLPHIEGTIKQAFSYDEAKQIIDTLSIDFISVDIALTPEEENKTDIDRSKKDAGGIRVLKKLRLMGQVPPAVIVSGESLPSYRKDAYHKYGVLKFFQKDKFDKSQYENAVKSALYYLDAVQSTELESAKNSWHKALHAARIAGISKESFPKEFQNKGY